MRGDRPGADRQDGGDLRVGPAPGQVRGDLELADGEAGLPVRLGAAAGTAGGVLATARAKALASTDASPERARRAGGPRRCERVGSRAIGGLPRRRRRRPRPRCGCAIDCSKCLGDAEKRRRRPGIANGVGQLGEVLERGRRTAVDRPELDEDLKG